MIRAVLYAIFTALLVAFVIWISQNPGEVTVNWLGYQVNTSALLLVLALLLLILLVLFMVRLLQLPLSFFSFLKNGRNNSKLKAQKKLMIEILSATTAKDEAKYPALEKRINSVFEDNSDLKNMLLLSVTKGEKRLEILNNFTPDNETELATLKVRIDDALSANKKSEALQLYRKAFSSFPKIDWVAKDFVNLLAFFGEWTELLETLEIAYKKGAVTKAYFIKAKSTALLERGVQNNNCSDIFKASKIDENNLEAQIKAADCFFKEGRRKKAIALLSSAWKKFQNIIIYDALVNIVQDLPIQKKIAIIEKMVKKTEGNPTSLLALADAFANIRLYAQARAELDKYLLLYPSSARAARIMAKLEYDENPDSDATKKWRALADASPIQKMWTCEKCGNSFAEWHALCSCCGAFADVKLSLQNKD